MSFLTVWNSAPRRAWPPALWDNELNRLFDDNVPADFSPAADLEETETHFVLDFDLPGVKKEDIQIEVRDRNLHVSGERKFEKKSKTHSERFAGKFERVWALPEGVEADKVEAAFSDGVLTVKVPKAEAAKPRVIKIQDGKAA